jgi:hypothetical protein
LVYTDAQSQQFLHEIADRVRAVPGVKAVTMTTSIPMLNDTLGGVPIAPEGFQFPPGKENTETLASREMLTTGARIAIVRAYSSRSATANRRAARARKQRMDVRNAMVKDGRAHIESLRDGRRIFIDGACVDDHTRHPAFRNAVASAARLYDVQADSRNLEKMTFTSPTSGERVSRIWQLPTSLAELMERRQALEAWAELTCGMLGRSPDHVASCVSALPADAIVEMSADVDIPSGPSTALNAGHFLHRK